VKNQNPDNDDRALAKTLKEWRVEAALPPGFQQTVWRKIDQQRKPSQGSIIEVMRAWMNGFVARPRVAAGYLAALVVVGVSAGWTQGHRDNLRVENELADRYVRVLDPYRAPRT
jgi:hypothetical protein